MSEIYRALREELTDAIVRKDRWRKNKLLSLAEYSLPKDQFERIADDAEFHATNARRMGKAPLN